MANENQNIINKSNKQHLRWGNSSELKSENIKILVYVGIRVTTQLKLNDKNWCDGGGIRGYIMCSVSCHIFIYILLSL